MTRSKLIMVAGMSFVVGMVLAIFGPGLLLKKVMGAGDSPVSLSLASSSWQESAVGTVPLANDQDGNLTFAFPVNSPVCASYSCGVCTAYQPVDSINYLYTAPGVSSIAGYNSISVSLAVSTSGPVVFDYQTETGNTCVFPAHVRVFIWQWNDATQGYDRWWSNSISYELASGTATITTALTPDQWSSVYGQAGNANAAATQGFYDALNNVRYVGLTFGGGCFFGHGVNVSDGTAQFTLTNYSIQ